MSEIESIQRYIDRTNMKHDLDGYSMRHDDIFALLSSRDMGFAVIMAFEYGKAKGYRAAKAEARR